MVVPLEHREAPRRLTSLLALVLPAVLATPAAAFSQDVDCVRYLDRAIEMIDQYWSFTVFKVGAYDLAGERERLRPDAVAATTPDACADVLDRLMASLRDGHANLTRFPGRTPQSIPPGIRLKRFSDRIARPGMGGPVERLYVVAKDTTDASIVDIPIGSEVLTIDGRPAQEVLDSVQARVSASTTWGLVHWTDQTVLRGPAGSDVTLLLRTPAGEVREVTLQRRGVPDPDAESEPYSYVEHRILDSGYGYLRLRGFDERIVTRQFDEALDALRDTPGLVLDLRDNGGGLVTVLQEVAGRFFDRHVVLARIMIRNPGEQVVTRDLQPIVARSRGWTYRQPVVLIVNAGCFSACDVFTSAMDEHGRALIIGPTRTGGGSASPVGGGITDTFDGAQIRLSFFIAYRGDETHIESIGISPHVVVQPTLEDYIAGRDILLERAEAALRDGEADFGAL
ncbi:MAG TPA: S41 family peptidase [Longimicrobiales bacterium]|nr:S41 family peptidase [Longimicrobiales bacterium]